MTGEAVAVSVRGLGKRYCQSLSHAMVYAMQDVGRELLGLDRRSNRLRGQEFWALDGVDLEARFGECLALLGPNRAGKSTLLRLMAGIVPPDRGRIELAGRAASLLELGAGFHPLLSGRENVYLLAAILDVSRQDVTPVKLYSSGMGMRLGFSTVVHLAPRILLVDEALAVGDVGFQRRCLRKMREYVREGGCVVLVTHDVFSAYSICTSSVVLHAGRVAFTGPVEQAAAVYHDASLAAAASSSPTEEAFAGGRSEMRYGSGGAELESLEVETPADSLSQHPGCARLAARRPAVFVLTILAREAMQDIQVGFSIWDSGGEAMLMMNNQGVGRRLPPLKPNQRLRLRLRFSFDCPLPAGHYRIGAGIISPDAGGFLDRRLNWRALEVVSGKPARSLVDIACNVEARVVGEETGT